MLINPAGFSEEERRVKQRMLELGILQVHIAESLKMNTRDVNAVVRQRSRSPSHIKKVYEVLGLEMPNEEVIT